MPWTGHIAAPPGTPHGLLRYLVSVGPLARSVADLRLALKVIAGPDGKQWEIPPVTLTLCPPRPLREMRIAWSDDFGGVPITAETRDALEKMVEALEQKGCRTERINPPDFDFALATMLRQKIQMSAVFARGTPLHLPRWVVRKLGKVLFRDNPVSRGYLGGMGANLAEYGKALARRDRLIAALEQFLTGWDGWLCPVAPMPAFPHLDTSNAIKQLRATVEVDGKEIPYTLANSAYTDPFNTTGNPVVVLPLTRSNQGLPIGVQVVGRRWKDMELLAMAESLTQVTEGYRSPPGC